MVEIAKNDSRIKFEVHLEDWWSAVHTWPNDETVASVRLIESIEFILQLLEKYSVKADFYVLGMIAEMYPETIQRIAKKGHKIGSHGYLHYHNEHERDKGDLATREILATLGIECVGYCSPYWNSTPIPGKSGGFFFRALPLWWIKNEIKKSSVFWIHPHDIMLDHPKIKSPFLNWKRHFGLKQSRLKLERLLSSGMFN